MKLAILDYGVGNLYSLKCAINRMNANPLLVEKPPKANNIDGMILPGVGGFKSASKKLSGYREDILELVEHGIPILGVCLGLQIFFESSEEGTGKGLGLFKGRVIRLPEDTTVPHMGWNNLHIVKDCFLTEGVKEGSWLYFVHSYYPDPEQRDIVIAETSYTKNFPVMVSNGQISGTQFHPEKSGEAGQKILSNFIEFCRRGK